MWAACKVLDTADLLGNSHKFLEFIQNQNKKHSTSDNSGKLVEIVDKKGKRNIARLVRAARKDMATQINFLHNCVEQKSISVSTKHGTLLWLGYNSRQNWVPLLSDKSTNLRISWAQVYINKKTT